MMQAEQKLWFKNTGLVPIRSTLLKGYFFFLGFNELDPRIHAAEFLFHINEKKIELIPKYSNIGSCYYSEAISQKNSKVGTIVFLFQFF